ncbi:unnamed protein product, partial [Allacma fusca]
LPPIREFRFNIQTLNLRTRELCQIQDFLIMKHEREEKGGRCVQLLYIEES